MDLKERDTYLEEQRLFKVMDRMLPKEFKTSSYEQGSEMAILENILNCLILVNGEHRDSTSELPQSVTNSSTVSSGDTNQTLPQPYQQNNTKINREMLQQPSLNFKKIKTHLPCQPAAPLPNPSQLQQVPLTPLQSSHQRMSNFQFHPMRTNPSQHIGNTSATSTIPLQSSHQLLINFHSSNGPVCSMSLRLPVSNEQDISKKMVLDMLNHRGKIFPSAPDSVKEKTDSSAANLIPRIPQGFSERDWKQDNFDTTSSGQISRQGSTGSNRYNTSTTKDGLELENSFFVPAADTGLRQEPEEQTENLSKRNIDSDRRPDSTTPHPSV